MKTIFTAPVGRTSIRQTPGLRNQDIYLTILRIIYSIKELKCIFVKTSVCQYLYKRIKTKSFTRHKSHKYSLIWTCRKTSLCFQHENGIWILLSDIQMKYCQSFSILKYKLFNIYSCSQMPLRARLLNALTTVTVYTYLGLNACFTRFSSILNINYINKTNIQFKISNN